MKTLITLTCSFLLVPGLLAGAEADVFVGTAGVGHVTPAATAPFGMVQAGPDTSPESHWFKWGWDHTCGYQYSDPWCWRFSQTHISGTGCISFGDYGLMPFVEGADPVKSAAKILKAHERGEPGSYATRIAWGEKSIDVEIAARERSAAYRIAYPKGDRAKLLFDLDWAVDYPANSPTDCWGYRIRACKSEFVSPTELRGERDIWSWNGYRICIASVFSAPIVGKRLVRKAEGERGEIWELDFGVVPDGVLEIRLGLSRTSAAKAADNLRAEIPSFDFAAVRAKAAEAWAEKLGRLAITDASDPMVAKNFRSALYRTMMQPNLTSDVGAPRRFSTFSLWDTFRAAHPLYTILAPEYVDDFVNSMLDQYDRQGYLPIWALGGGENHCMIGHHAVPVIVDAYLKGFRGFDAKRAQAAIRDSLTRNHKPVNDGTWGLLKEDWDIYDRYGYYPFDQMRGSFGSQKVKGESVSRTLECAYDDACAARLCRELGFKDDEAFFAKRADSWRNVFDAKLGFMRGKDSKGRWREPFDPFALGGGPWNDNDFCEGNAWQYTWHVMQDAEGLIASFGGRKPFVERLQRLFELPPHEYKDRPTSDVTGLIGQYAHGNEPSHHTAYFFALAGRNDLTAKYVRKVFDTQYFPRPDGLCGNDDCGQMAAWYVFSALGFYPFDPCGGEYVIGAPQVKKATLRCTPAPNTYTCFTVIAKGLSKENRYVKSVTLNGKPITDWKIRHADIVKGGELVFEMTDRCPNAAPLERTFDVPGIGEAKLSCKAPGSWTFATSVERKADGTREILVRATAPEAAAPSRFDVGFTVPQAGHDHFWMANRDDFGLPPDWAGWRASELSSGLPLYCYFDGQDRARLTVAASDAARFVEFRGGLVEEDCRIKVNFEFLTQKEAPLKEYSVSIRIDDRTRPFAEAVRDGADWIFAAIGGKDDPVPEAAFAPLYSSWYQFHQNVFDKEIEAECALAAKDGMKVLIVDDGWQTDDNHRGYSFCGDWEVSTNRFPNMCEHVARVHKLGMKYMMWFSVPFVGKNSRFSYERFKDKLLDDHGDGTCVLDPRYPEVRDYLAGVYERAVREWDIDGVKLDFIDTMTSRLLGKSPKLLEEGTGRDTLSVSEGVDRLLMEVTRRLRAIKPDILVEFRQGYIGPVVRKYGNMLRAGDCPGDRTANRIRIANLRLTSGTKAVHADMLEWNKSDTAEHAALAVMNAMFGVVQYSMMLRELPESHRAMIRAWIAFSQEHRETLLKGAFRPHFAQLGYPVIEAESDAERIVGVYVPGQVVSVGAPDRKVIVLNATGTNEIVLDLEAAPKKVTAYNTFGQPVPQTFALTKGLNRIIAPPAGRVELEF